MSESERPHRAEDEPNSTRRELKARLTEIVITANRIFAEMENIEIELETLEQERISKVRQIRALWSEENEIQDRLGELDS